MRAAPDLHVEWVDDEAVILDPATQPLHYLNPPAALAFALVAEHGYDKALKELRARYGDSPDFQEQVAGLIGDLSAKGLLTQ